MVYAWYYGLLATYTCPQDKVHLTLTLFHVSTIKVKITWWPQVGFSDTVRVSIYVVNRMIAKGRTCQSGQFYLTLTSFSWSMLSSCFSLFFQILIAIGQLYLVYVVIVSCICLSDRIYLTLTFLSWIFKDDKLMWYL